MESPNLNRFSFPQFHRKLQIVMKFSEYRGFSRKVESNEVAIEELKIFALIVINFSSRRKYCFIKFNM